MAGSDIRTYEVTFCSRVAGWLNALFAKHPEWPFRRAEIEESKAIHRKRSDLRIYGDGKTLILAGEVKLPGTVESRTPYNAGLVVDSSHQAANTAPRFINRARKLAGVVRLQEVSTPRRAPQQNRIDNAIYGVFNG